MVLKEPTFDWYSKLSPNSIPDWPNMKTTFLYHFYNTRRTIGLKERSTIEQDATESIVDYIRQWQPQSLHFSQELSQEEATKLCMSGLHPWIGF